MNFTPGAWHHACGTTTVRFALVADCGRVPGDLRVQPLLQIGLPRGPMLLVLLLQAGANGSLRRRIKAFARLAERDLFVQLLIDMLALSVLMLLRWRGQSADFAPACAGGYCRTQPLAETRADHCLTIGAGLFRPQFLPISAVADWRCRTRCASAPRRHVADLRGLGCIARVVRCAADRIDPPARRRTRGSIASKPCATSR